MAGESYQEFDKGYLSLNLKGVVTAAALQRFGYYGIRSVLIIYLTTELKMPDHLAGQIYGAFYGSLFLTSLVGGLLGDTTLGYRLIGSIGFVFIVASHLCLATENVTGAVMALVLYSIGFGLFDPNMNAAVAHQYQADQRLRDAAYTILYSGINIGAMLGPLVCGYITTQTSWRYGFLVGGLFSLIGLVFFIRAIKNHNGELSSFSSADDVNREECNEGTVTTYSVGKQFTIIGILTLLAITFWAVFDQLGSSVTLLVQRHVSRRFGAFEIPAGYIQSVNPFLVVILGPLLSFVLRRKLLSERRNHSIEALISGIMLLGIGFGLLAWGSIGVGGTGTQGTVRLHWVLFAVFFATVGELLFAPAATSLVAGLSLKKRRAFIMGAWSATFGIGAYLSGTMSGSMNTFKWLSSFFAISAGACWLTGLAFLIIIRKATNSSLNNYK